ncbi:MAG TPA: Stp1/IreP family PP2C-type Ser/Thr phosphatase [Gammaproteobacteria bacterium]|nr:Stp1/IreP family PP2C-type Ser/Thr phosphatase [Gammaproteobacteria bacterium]
MDMSGVIEIVNMSDTGRKRPHNEDSTVSDSRMGLAIVADGMGGYKGGEVASAIAVTSILHEMREGLSHINPSQIDKASGHSMGALLLRDAITLANSQIFQTASQEPICQGMGTTVVAVLVHDGNKISIAHVGDSRLYRLRNGQFEQVTSDHSLIQELINKGYFTKEEAMANTPKNLVTRALGIEEDVVVDIQDEVFEPQDTYLMCSDGLNDMISDEEIHLTLSKYSGNLIQAAGELIRIANQNGGKDNISVILIRPRSGAGGGSGWRKKLFRWFS